MYRDRLKSPTWHQMDRGGQHETMACGGVKCRTNIGHHQKMQYKPVRVEQKASDHAACQQSPSSSDMTASKQKITINQVCRGLSFHYAVTAPSQGL